MSYVGYFILMLLRVAKSPGMVMLHGFSSMSCVVHLLLKFGNESLILGFAE